MTTNCIAFIAGVFGLLLAAGTCVANQESAGEVLAGRDLAWGSSSLGCGTLLMNSDSTYENGYGWSYGGTDPPDYGAFAECYTGQVRICSGVFDFTQAADRPGQTMDVYVWSDGGGRPGAVLSLVAGVDPDPIAFWPEVSRHVVPIDLDCTEATAWWMGFWGAWPGSPLAWFVGADLNGPTAGCPMTKITPGIGFPAGWNDVSIVWGPTAAIGIGAEVMDCTVPTAASSWGRIKRRFY